MSPNGADRMTNSVDPDQTAPLGAVWSGSALFAQAYLSENLGSLRYLSFVEFIRKMHFKDWITISLAGSVTPQVSTHSANFHIQIQTFDNEL